MEKQKDQRFEGRGNLTERHLEPHVLQEDRYTGQEICGKYGTMTAEPRRQT
jgi:hypothetical protein